MFSKIAGSYFFNNRVKGTFRVRLEIKHDLWLSSAADPNNTNNGSQ